MGENLNWVRYHTKLEVLNIVGQEIYELEFSTAHGTVESVLDLGQDLHWISTLDVVEHAQIWNTKTVLLQDLTCSVLIFRAQKSPCA